MEIPDKDETSMLFQRIAKGDPQAFKQIFETYRLDLYRIAFGLTKSRSASEDIVQEVFKDLWEGKHNLAGVENPPSYIFTIGYRKSFRHLKQVSENRVLFEELKKNLRSLSHSLEQKMEAEETYQILRKIVDDLPPRRQQIFRLSREKGLSHAEIAEKLDISPLTVKKQITLALHTIRAGLAKTTSGFRKFL